ncbi:MAG TPA: hypothetical protein VFD84_10295 [Candidatus Binatia bacterium]|nr:hypothetical protein [Candidatus Binatia bacterium]
MRTLRRLRWLLADLTRVVRALARVRAEARRPDPPRVALARLEGGPWAERGRPNAYRVRVVNEHAAPRPVVLRLAGDADGAPPLETRGAHVIPAAAALDLVLLTDWRARFDLVAEAPSDDALAFLAPREATGRCRLSAVLEAEREAPAALTIAQPLVR